MPVINKVSVLLISDLIVIVKQSLPKLLKGNMQPAWTSLEAQLSLLTWEDFQGCVLASSFCNGIPVIYTKDARLKLANMCVLASSSGPTRL